MDVLQHDMENYVESSKEGELRLFFNFSEMWKEENLEKEEQNYDFLMYPLPTVHLSEISLCDINYNSRINKNILNWYFDYRKVLGKYYEQLPALLSYSTMETAEVFESERFVCQIIEVEEKQVIADVIVEDNVSQTRKFDIAPLRGEINLEPGEAFILLIQTKQGERRFVYRKASESDKLVLTNRNKKDLFSKYANSSFFKAAPKNDQDDF